MSVPIERAVARVDLGAVERNCRALAARAGHAALCAVVKADGYGHGAIECARAAQAGGAEWLAVATAAEAAELRAHGIDGPLLVMGALTGDDLDVAIRHGADVVGWTPEFVGAAAQAAERVGVRARTHVKFDSGMGRLGEPDPGRVRAVCAAVAADQRLELVGLMTHFATADELGDDYFDAQLERFRALAEAVRAEHPRILCHAANSAATLRDPASHFDLVRCGIAVYGLDPFQRDPYEHGLEPALRLESYVAQTKVLEPGQSVGYGRTWSAERPTTIGTVPIGYGDGVRRGLSNNADVLVGGRRRPLAGTVSMDNVTVDLGSEEDVRIGEPVVLIGSQGSEHVLCEEVARRLGTINYEITCGLSARVRRVYERS